MAMEYPFPHTRRLLLAPFSLKTELIWQANNKHGCVEMDTLGEQAMKIKC